MVRGCRTQRLPRLRECPHVGTGGKPAVPFTVRSSASSRLISGRQAEAHGRLGAVELQRAIHIPNQCVQANSIERISRARLNEDLEAKRQLHADLDGLAQTIRSQQAQTKEIVAPTAPGRLRARRRLAASARQRSKR